MCVHLCNKVLSKVLVTVGLCNCGDRVNMMLMGFCVALVLNV